MSSIANLIFWGTIYGAILVQIHFIDALSRASMNSKCIQ